jgi:hypothetical protein
MTYIETPNEEFVVCPSEPIPLGLSSKGKKWAGKYHEYYKGEMRTKLS